MDIHGKRKARVNPMTLAILTLPLEFMEDAVGIGVLIAWRSLLIELIEMRD
jgi:hypothetical protein